MTQLSRRSQLIAGVFGAVVSIFLVCIYVHATTTVGDDVSIGGSATTTLSHYVGDTITASSTLEQLRLAYDVENSYYSSFTISSAGDMTVELAGNATTTFQDALKVYRTAGGANERLFQVGTSTDDNIFVVKSSGYVGIGTEIGTSTLQVTAGDVHFEKVNGEQGMYWDNSTGYLGVGTTSPGAVVHISRQVGAGDDLFKVGTSTDDDLFTIKSSGNIQTSGAIRFGTATPTSPAAGDCFLPADQFKCYYGSNWYCNGSTCDE